MQQDALDTPLITLSEFDDWTLRDAFSGCQIFGSTGSGKTSGSGATIARGMLEAGLGGCVLTVKNDEKQQWVEWAKECGRVDQVVVFKPKSPYFYDFLKAEVERAEGAGTENEVSLLMTITEIANGGELQSKESYWLLALRQMLRNGIDLLKCAGQEVSIYNLYRLINNAPTSTKQYVSEEWQKRFFFQCMVVADQKGQQIPREQKPVWFRDLDVVSMYWMDEFPNLAEKTRSIIVSMFTTMADAFIRGDLRTLFSQIDKGDGGGTHEASPELAREGAIIICDLPIKNYESIGLIGQGLYKLMFQKTMERTRITADTNGVFLWADENQYFLNSFDVMFQTTARSAMVATCYLTQSISGYEMNLGDNGETKANAILSNLATKIVHSSSDPKTNEWISSLIGERYVRIGGSSTSYGEDGHLSSGMNVNEQKRRIVEPIELTELRRGGAENHYIVSGILHQVGRTFEETGASYLPVNFKQK